MPVSSLTRVKCQDSHLTAAIIRKLVSKLWCCVRWGSET